MSAKLETRTRTHARTHAWQEAQELADKEGVRIFTADIIYHLFDQFSAYLKQARVRAVRAVCVCVCVCVCARAHARPHVRERPGSQARLRAPTCA